MHRSVLLGYLNAGPESDAKLFDRASEVRDRALGDGIYLRGLIELSNRCVKDCLYCGIRASNLNVSRYELTDEEVLGAAGYAWKEGYGSVVIQAGERTDERFVEWVESLVKRIKELSDNQLGITLSLGEQGREVYRRWYEAGAHRYLLRIETCSPGLYRQIHPQGYSLPKRLECLSILKEQGYQVGTGVMIGLPGQTLESLANDLLRFKEMDIDMCGMGPYIEHPDTPMGKGRRSAFTPQQRLRLTLRMIAALRLLMPDINIASTTALHALHPQGREMGIAAGANVVMPNITPQVQRGNYRLYDGKPLNDMNLGNFQKKLRRGEWGDAKHFRKRRNG